MKLRGSTIEQIFEFVFAHGETIVQRMNICHRIAHTIFNFCGHCTPDTFFDVQNSTKSERISLLSYIESSVIVDAKFQCLVVIKKENYMRYFNTS